MFAVVLLYWRQKFKFCKNKTQPDHEEYPLKFPANPQCSRNIFIGSHVELKMNYL